jgi:GNAT superfamily N-acetyltransferase
MSNTVVQSFSIAPATVRDCRECAGLLVEQVGEHGVNASVEQMARVLENVVVDPARGFLLLARDNSRIIGVAYVATILSAEHCGLVAWLEELYVIAKHRSRGVGKALLTAVLDRARGTGVVAVDLEIDADHSRAESLYRRFGFRHLQRSRWVKELTT